jgi:hypothetical protein
MVLQIGGIEISVSGFVPVVKIQRVQIFKNRRG